MLRKLLPLTRFEKDAIKVAKIDKFIEDTENDVYGTKLYHFGGALDELGKNYTEGVITLLKQMKELLKKSPINKIRVYGPNSGCTTWSIDNVDLCFH